MSAAAGARELLRSAWRRVAVLVNRVRHAEAVADAILTELDE